MRLWRNGDTLNSLQWKDAGELRIEVRCCRQTGVNQIMYLQDLLSCAFIMCGEGCAESGMVDGKC